MTDMRIAARAALGLLCAAALSAAGAAQGVEIGATGKKLIVKTNTVANKHKVVSIQQSPSIVLGAPGFPADMSGSLQIFYVDTPLNTGVLGLPSPWATTSSTVFKFKNASAPAGPSPVKSALAKATKLAKVVSKGLGGLDISTAPGANGVIAVFTLDNASDFSQLKLCTRYSVADGSTVKHKVTGSGFLLKLKNGVGTACPGCTDGIQNFAETDVDCGGGTCAACGTGDSCLLASDCASGVCALGTCQAPSCSDFVQNQGETGVDCGGPCSGCPFGGGCAMTADCAGGLSCVGSTCVCNNNLFTFTVNSNSGGVFDSAEWPGGFAGLTSAPGCNVTINRPNDNVDLVCTLAAPFSVFSFNGFSNCFGTGGEDGDGCQPVSCPPAGIGSCCNARPSCSAALNGSASAQYFVQCLQ